MKKKVIVLIILITIVVIIGYEVGEKEGSKVGLDGNKYESSENISNGSASDNINNNNSSASASSNKQEEKIDALSYLGLWYELGSNRYSSQIFVDETANQYDKELLIWNIDEKNVKFDLSLYNKYNIKNIDAKIEGNTANFIGNINNKKIEGSLIFSSDSIKCNITSSEVKEIQKSEIIYSEQYINEKIEVWKLVNKYCEAINNNNIDLINILSLNKITKEDLEQLSNEVKIKMYNKEFSDESLSIYCFNIVVKEEIDGIEDATSFLIVQKDSNNIWKVDLSTGI